MPLQIPKKPALEGPQAKLPEPIKVEPPIKPDYSELQIKATLNQVDQLKEVSVMLERLLNKPGEPRPKKLIATVTNWVKVDGQNRIKTLEIKLE